MDIYKVVYSAAALALCWMLQSWSFSSFLDTLDDGPPPERVFTLEDIPPEDRHRPLAQIAAEHGVALNDLLVSKTQYGEKLNAYQKGKWLGLLGTIIGACGGYLFALRLGESHLIAIAAVLIGPFVIALVMRRQAHWE